MAMQTVKARRAQNLIRDQQDTMRKYILKELRYNCRMQARLQAKRNAKRKIIWEFWIKLLLSTKLWHLIKSYLPVRPSTPYRHILYSG